MHQITALLAAEHLQDLMREAADSRRASLVARARQRCLPAWRRLSARVAHGLSVGLGVVASRLDPVDRGRADRRAEERTARPAAA